MERNFLHENNKNDQNFMQKMNVNLTDRNETGVIEHYLNTLLGNSQKCSDNNTRDDFDTYKDEIDLYKELIISADMQINTLKSLLKIKTKKLQKNENNLFNRKDLIFEKAFTEIGSQSKNSTKINQKQIISEKRMYKEKINEIKKENNYLYSNLKNEYEYFKNKLTIRKNNLMEIENHEKICTNLKLLQQEKSLKVLDKLIYLKNIINECRKYVNENFTKSSYKNTTDINDTKTIDNNNTVIFSSL